jgi:DNA-binding transcriptional ArsR family regulator
MAKLSDHLLSFDRLVHEPARLAILTVLTSYQIADFPLLKSITGLTQGNLSTHLSTLESAGLVAINKTFRGKMPCTTVCLTPQGAARYQQHWRRLDAVRRRHRSRARHLGR